MPLIYPQFEDLYNTIVAELRLQLPTIDPTVFGSWANGIAKGNAALTQSISLLVRDLEKQSFPQTAEGEFLDLWGSYEQIDRPQATASNGNASIEGTSGVLIPAGTVFTGSNGLKYTSLASVSIVDVNQSISAITRIGTTATARMDADHSLSTGMTVTISGATQAEYNGTYTISVISGIEFQYTISGSPVTPATGSPVYDATYANVSVESDDAGSDTNLDNAAILTLDTPITNADTSATVQYFGLSGGADLADDTTYRELILLSRALTSGVFTSDQIKLATLSITGNTRAWVKVPTLSGDNTFLNPSAGQTSVFFVRDNDANILPTPSIISTTKQKIIDEGKMPGNTVEDDVFVQGPTLVNVDYVFASINPDTPTMRTAIANSLDAFYQDTIDFEEDVVENSWLGAIQNTQDAETGDILQSFTLSSPVADITINDGELAVLGTVTYP